MYHDTEVALYNFLALKALKEKLNFMMESVGASAVLYHSANPSKEFGPHYKCSYSTSQRIRTCNNGVLSVVPRECSQYDSGGCVDAWEDLLQDTEFVFARCND